MKQIIENALNSSELTNKINEAASLKMKIAKEYKDEMRDMEDTYVQNIIRLDKKAKAIQEKQKKNRTEEEKIYLAEFAKKHKQVFKNVKKAICPTIKSDGSQEIPVVKAINKIVEVCKMLDYLDRNDILELFEKSGIKISFKKLEEEHSEYADKKVKESLKYIFKATEELDGEIKQVKSKIKDEIYMDLDPNIRFSKVDPENPEGLKASQFEKLATQRSIALMKSSEDYEKYKNKLLETTQGDLTSMQMMLEKASSL
mgnify:CR=1 FL=1